jgi:signal transduction histidine kinase
MDISDSRPQQSLLILAASALVLLGLSISALTWRNLSQQRQLIDHHVLFAARTIMRGLEANLSRTMPMMGRPSPQADKARIEGLFRDVVKSGDVLYLGVYDPQGRLIMSSSAAGAPQTGQPSGPDEVALDPLALSDLAVNGEWFGSLPLGTGDIMGYAARLRPDMPRLCPMPDCDPARGQEPAAYFLVGLSLEEHYAQYHNFKRTALFQTGFVLAAALLVWIPLFAFLRRKEQGRKLTRLESFHSKLLDAMPEALMTIGQDGLVRAVNLAAKAIFGPNLAGRALADLPLGQALAEPQSGGPGEAEAGGWRQVELEGRFLEVLNVPLSGETLLLARDRTQLRSLEQGLEESRRLAAIGRLSAQVAHEIRNPLSALRGFAQLFAAKLKGKEPEQGYAQTMVAEADRLDRVVTDLLYLARPRQLTLSPVDLPGLADDLERLMQFDLQRRKGLWRTELTAESVLADQDSLKQALINLILNALAALPPSGGGVTLGSRALADGVELSLSDTGRGMDQAERERILEPFFTTRQEGSGLGLAIVQKIVRDHKGRLDVESRPGQGTTVRMFFPGAA